MSALPTPKIVKVIGSSTGFAVRVIHPDGYEIDFSFHSTLEEAQRNLNKYKKKLCSDGGYAIAIAINALGEIMDLTHRIHIAGDVQGVADYATKAHMRQWALQANRVAANARRAMEDVEASTLDVIPLVIKDNEYEPADQMMANVKNKMGGWTEGLLEEYGVDWPPPDGWQQDLVNEGLIVQRRKETQ